MFSPHSLALKWEKGGRDGVMVSHFYGFGAFEQFTAMMQGSIKGARSGIMFGGNDKTVAPDCRSFYELIPTTSTCKLYFDVETRLDHKVTDAEQETVIADLLACVRGASEEFKLDIPDSNLRDVVILSANRFKKGAWKLSYHFIFHSIFFPDNHTSMKTFVDRMSAVAAKLDIARVDGKVIWDTGVYTRNRVMRLMNNIKPGDLASELMPVKADRNGTYSSCDFSCEEFRRSFITDTVRLGCDMPFYTVQGDQIRPPNVLRHTQPVRLPRGFGVEPFFTHGERYVYYNIFVDFYHMRRARFGVTESDLPPMDDMKFGGGLQKNLVFFNIQHDRYCEYKGRQHTVDGGSKTGYYLDILNQFVSQTCFACVPAGQMSTVGVLYNTHPLHYLEPVQYDLCRKISDVVYEGECVFGALIARQAKEMVCSIPSSGDKCECYVFDDRRSLWSCQMEHWFLEFISKWVSRFYIIVKLLDPDSCEDKKGVNFGKWCKKYQDHAGMVNIRRIIKSLTVVHDFLPRLNQQVAFIPIQNGLVVDLRTGATRARTADDLFTMEMNFSLLEEDSPEVSEVANFMMEFAKDCPDTYQYCQELYGYLLSGWIFDRAFYLMLGNGANGKGTVSAALQKVMGDFFQVAPSSFLTKKANAKTGAESASPQFYKMRFARVLMASELSKNEVLDFAKIKGLSAGDPFSVRPLYREPETVVPRFKVVIQSNFSPDIDGSDLAIIDRYRLVMFKQRYANNPQAGELKKDVNRVERFLSLTDAFGTWMVQGARLMFARGGGTEVVVPDSIQHTTTKQLEQANLMGVFLRLECEVAMGEVDEADLFQEYCGFASKRRHNDQSISFPEFQKKLMSFSNMGFQRAGAIIVGLRMKRYVAPVAPVAPVAQVAPVAPVDLNPVPPVPLAPLRSISQSWCVDCVFKPTPCTSCLAPVPKCKGCGCTNHLPFSFGFCAKCREPLP